MTRVALIVTGELEKKSLHLSLARFFPKVEFEVLQLDGFTSRELPDAPAFEEGHPSLVEKLAGALIAAVDPGRLGTPADLAFLVDDLELYNAATPERAVRHVRAAMLLQLEARWSKADRRRQSADVVRQRCSFHLLAPMVEAYFFGEPAALERAGAMRPALFDPRGCDVERFTTGDPDFLAPPDGKQPVWAKLGRAQHPKHYVRFLCDPEGNNPRAYRETKHGHEALRSLDWPCVLAPEAHARFARSFLTDLADGLDQPAVAALFPGERHALTSRNARDNVLRNL
jgi:hypothetical protein